MTASRHLVESNWQVNNSLRGTRESISFETAPFQQKSNDRLPKISSGRLASPQPRRKLAVVDNVHNKEKAQTHEDLPNIKTDQRTTEHHENNRKKRRNLSTSKSPNLPRKSSPVGFSKSAEESRLMPCKSPEARRTRTRHESLQPLSPGQYNFLQVSPLPRRKFQSTVERNPQTSKRNTFKQSKSISLEDIFLSDHKGSEDRRGDEVKGYSENTVCAWSQHWHYTRKSIGARPDQEQIIAFANSPKFCYHNLALQSTTDNDTDENDALFSKFMNDNSISQLSLEERLDYIEKQQGLSNE